MENSSLLTSVPSVKEVMSICSTDPETLMKSDGKKHKLAERTYLLL